MNSVEKELLALAVKAAQKSIDPLGQSPDQLLANIDNPDWGSCSKVHDWRNHVMEELRSRWHCLSLEARLVLYLTAVELAADEIWDWGWE